MIKKTRILKQILIMVRLKQLKNYFLGLSLVGKIAAIAVLISLAFTIFPIVEWPRKWEQNYYYLYPKQHVLQNKKWKTIDGVSFLSDYDLKSIKKEYGIDLELDDIDYSNSFSSPKRDDCFWIFQGKYDDGSKTDVYFIKGRRNARGGVSYENKNIYAIFLYFELQNEARKIWGFFLLASGAVLAYITSPAFKFFTLKLFAKSKKLYTKYKEIIFSKIKK